MIDISLTPFIERSAGNTEFRAALEQVRDPVRQLARGGPQQVRATQRVLTEGRRSLDLTLAEIPEPEEEASQQ